jgi:hypothetical protein
VEREITTNLSGGNRLCCGLQDEGRRFQVVRDLGEQVRRMWEQITGREEQRAWESAAARLLVAVCEASPAYPAARDFNCGYLSAVCLLLCWTTNLTPPPISLAARLVVAKCKAPSIELRKC